MNEKDYKKIAEIIKEFRDMNNYKNTLWGINTLVDKLASYFETQAPIECNICKAQVNSAHANYCPKRDLFERKQFLKDCGVEE